MHIFNYGVWLLSRSLFPLMKQPPWRMLTSFSKFLLVASLCVVLYINFLIIRFVYYSSLQVHLKRLIYCQVSFTAASLAPEVQTSVPSGLTRQSPYLTHPIFNMYIPFQKFVLTWLYIYIVDAYLNLIWSG